MGSLSELLSRIYQLPKEELQPRIPKSKRPNEMAIFEKVIPDSYVERLRSKRVGFTRACFIRQGRAEMEFRILRHDVGHKLVASLDSTGVVVEHTTEFRSERATQQVPINSVREFRKYILLVAFRSDQNTT